MESKNLSDASEINFQVVLVDLPSSSNSIKEIQGVRETNSKSDSKLIRCERKKSA